MIRRLVLLAAFLATGAVPAFSRPTLPAAQADAASDEVSIRTLKEGDGASITANDGVVINYAGRLGDGTVFDNSWESGPVPLLVNQTIPGFAQALQQMRKGGHYEIFIPARLAYGANPPPSMPIPPNSDLTYDVVVLDVVANAAVEPGDKN